MNSTVLLIIFGMLLMAWILVGQYRFISIIEWLGGLLLIISGMVIIYYQPTLGQVRHIIEKDLIIFKVILIDYLGENCIKFFHNNGTNITGIVFGVFSILIGINSYIRRDVEIEETPKIESPVGPSVEI